MSSSIRIKRSEVAGNPSILAAGELAYSALADNGSNGGDRLYIGMGTETGGNAANHVVIGGKYFTDQITAATSLNNSSTIVKRDANGNFSAGIITAALSGNATTSSAWQNSRSVSITGDATWTVSIDGSSNVSAALTLASTGVTAGAYGSSSTVPNITVDEKGRITAISTSSISTGLNIQVGSETDTILSGTETLVFAGGLGISADLDANTNTVSFSLPQALDTNSDVAFNNVSITGYIRGPSTLVLDPAAHGDDTGTVVIAGNLTVQGTTTTINSTVVSVADLTFALAKDANTAAEANGAGIFVNGANATISYSSADDRWNLNKDLNVANVYGNLIGNAATSTKWETSRTISITGDATWTASIDGSANATATLTLANTGVTSGTYNNVTVDAKGRVTSGSTVAYLTSNQSITVSGDVSGSGTTSITTTLANTGVTAGSYGSSTSLATFTVDSKGRLTSADSIDIPIASTTVLGLASFDASSFSVSNGLVSLATVDGGTY